MSFGSQTFGSGTYNTGDVITGIAPALVSRAGGEKIIVFGNFNPSFTYQVTVGGIVAYSGVPGQGETILPDGDTLAFVLPPLGVAQIGSVTVEVTAFPSGETAQTSLTVAERSFGSAAFEMRRMFPRWYGTGPRRLETEPQEL